MHAFSHSWQLAARFPNPLPCPAATAAQYEQDFLPHRLGNWQVSPALEAKAGHRHRTVTSSTVGILMQSPQALSDLCPTCVVAVRDSRQPLLHAHRSTKGTHTVSGRRQRPLQGRCVPFLHACRKASAQHVGLRQFARLLCSCDPFCYSSILLELAPAPAMSHSCGTCPAAHIHTPSKASVCASCVCHPGVPKVRNAFRVKLGPADSAPMRWPKVGGRCQHSACCTQVLEGWARHGQLAQ